APPESPAGGVALHAARVGPGREDPGLRIPRDGTQSPFRPGFPDGHVVSPPPKFGDRLLADPGFHGDAPRLHRAGIERTRETVVVPVRRVDSALQVEAAANP